MTIAIRLTVKKVDTRDELVKRAIEAMHTEIFPPAKWTGERVPSGSEWWIAFSLSGNDKPVEVAFGGMRPSIREPGAGWLCSAGVLPKYRGLGIQKALIRRRIAYARIYGWKKVVTETIHDNAPSANALIACGFRQFNPEAPWGDAKHSVYWRRDL